LAIRGTAQALPEGPEAAETSGSIHASSLAGFRLRILATSDIHAHVLPHDYAKDTALPSAGLSWIASAIRTARSEVANSLTLDNGDFLDGNPLGRLIAQDGRLRPGQIHPVIAAMNAVGYDAAGLGNHEFSLGIDFLRQALRRARFPVLSSNAVLRLEADATADVPFVATSLILERSMAHASGAIAPIRIGLLSLLPPQLEIWEERHLGGRLRTRDILQAAAAWSADLRRRGADLVIALCHSGIGEAEYRPMMENAAVPVARLGTIDVLVAGHSHCAFPGPGTQPSAEVDPVAGRIHGKPVVNAGYRGSHLGIIDLDLDRFAGGWVVRGAQSRAVPVAGTDPRSGPQGSAGSDLRVRRAAARWHRATVEFVRRPVGFTDRPLHTYFARAAASDALDLVHAAQIGWAETVSRGTADEGLPVLSAASPIRAGGRSGPGHFTDVPAGVLLLRHVHEIYGFADHLRILRITGESLRNWLERSAAQFLTLVPGVPGQRLLDAAVPGYACDTIGGVSYLVDPCLPPAAGAGPGRIRNLRIGGRAVEPADRFLLVTHDFRRTGPPSSAATDFEVEAPQALVGDVLADFVRRSAPVQPRHRADWKLAGPPAGTSAWFDTGPGALAHAAEAVRRDIELGEVGDDGFLRCLIRF
jgi:2',3'-cyclic-nucleotide 2'-phosphodiesterase/3'-nucleotidase